MRFLPILIFSSVVVLTNGCATPNKPSCPLISKIFPSLRAESGQRASEVDRGQCGCDYCATVRETGQHPVIAPPMQQFSADPMMGATAGDCGCEGAITGDCGCGGAITGDCGCEGAEVLPGDCGCNGGEVFVDNMSTQFTPQGSEQFVPQTLPWASQHTEQFANPPVQKPVLTTPETEGTLAPPDPYVQPKTESLEIPRATIPQLDKDVGFLAPQNLVPQDEPENQEFDFGITQKTKAIPASSKKQIQPKLLDTVTPEPFGEMNQEEASLASETPLPARRIEPKTDDLIVLKARPVTSHRINNSPTDNETSTAFKPVSNSNRFDQFGLPTGQTVEFSSLPPIDAREPVREVRFQRDPTPAELPQLPTVGLDGSAIPTTQTSLTPTFDQKNFVSESSVYQEPILRMTATPTAKTDVRRDVTARIKFGQPLVVRGHHPESNQLKQNNFSQAVRTEIAPKTRMGTIDR